MRMGQAAAAYRIFIAAMMLVRADALPATPVLNADPLEAVWKVQHLAFVYRSSGTFYSCDSLKQKLRAILLVAGAHPSLSISTRCGAGVSNNIAARIAVATPVAATPENIAALTRHDTRDELIARLHDTRLADAGSISRFVAIWREQSLGTIHDVRITVADCDLLRDLNEQIFPHLDVRMVQKNPACDRLAANAGFASAARPNIRLLALIPAQSTQL